jgi:hypothetical protein
LPSDLKANPTTRAHVSVFVVLVTSEIRPPLTRKVRVGLFSR